MEAAGHAAAPAQDEAAKARQAEIAKQIAERADRELGLDLNETLARWGRDFDRIEAGIGAPKVNYSQLNAFRDQLEQLRGQLQNFTSAIEPQLQAVNTQASKLAPPPAQNQGAEPEEAARTRAEINGLKSTYMSAKTVAEQMAVRAAQLTSRIQDIRRARFTNRLFDRTSGVLSPDNWLAYPGNLAKVAEQSSQLVADWWRGLDARGGRDAKGDALQLFGLAFVLWLLLTLVAWSGIKRLRTWPGPDEPPFWKRAGSAAGIIILRALPVSALAVFTYQGLAASDLTDGRPDWVFYALARSLLIIAVVNALVMAVFSPHQPEWRLIPATGRAAKRVRWLVVALASVYALYLLLNTLSRLVSAPLSMTVTQSFLASLLISALLIAILRTPLGARTIIEGAPELGWFSALRLPVFGLTLAILFTAFAGYVRLSLFIATQVIVTGTILAVVYLMMIWVDAFGQSLTNEEAKTGRWLQTMFGFDQRRREQLALPVTMLLKAGVLLLSVPLILLQWGFNSRDVSDWFRQLFFGFEIGNTQISIAAILASFIVFILGYVAAKLFQGWLDKQVLKPAGLSGSVRDSIRTGVGYLGVLAAALIALSYSGLDLSNLAIVAGAFSVGIGFGLQSIVNNFVSGLILLAERPIRVGDWIVVGGEEGHVRRISVRSTEIETFDRASVIIPNSYFITESVKNWTLHNNSGRISIPVGVDYNSNPRQVRDILLKVAQSHLNVMTNPEPSVDFKDFGNDALSFVLYAHVYDLTKGGATRTDLRIAIMEAFHEAGVNIPFRQTDVSIKEMDWLREAVTDYLGRQPASGGASQQNGPIIVPPAVTRGETAS
jgi:small-conductance mechanosensitive channel